MSPQELARDLERRAASLEAAAVRGVERAQEVVLAEAVRQSSGTTSSKELRRQGHPFATRHGSPQAPLLPINRQSGRFQAAWEKGPVTAAGGDVSGSVVNNSPEAGFLATGTRLMFARPLPEAVVAATEPVVRRILAEEIGKVL